MKTMPWMLAGAALLLAALVLPAAQPSQKTTEAEIRRLNDQIARENRDQQKTDSEKDRLSRDLQEAERLVSKVSVDLSTLRNQRSSLLASRQQLAQERARRKTEQDAAREDLASQLRAAYFMGRNEPLKLLLNQRDPAQFGRNLTYYGYLGRLRAGQVNTITDNLVKIDALSAQIDEEDAKLISVESKMKTHAGELESAQKQRGRVLASLEQESRGRAATLRNLRAEREQMEKVLAELRRKAQASPFDPDTPFARSQHKLAWPVAGRIVTRFGENGSEGIDIDAARGAEVRAVHEGIVMMADYMPGRGNVIILNHGDGYWTIYAHNENLFKETGARVAAGEKIATAGFTGGRPRPGLHFEIRRLSGKSSKPLDPRGWFSTSAPPPG